MIGALDIPTDVFVCAALCGYCLFIVVVVIIDFLRNHSKHGR